MKSTRLRPSLRASGSGGLTGWAVLFFCLVGKGGPDEHLPSTARIHRRTRLRTPSCLRIAVTWFFTVDSARLSSRHIIGLGRDRGLRPIALRRQHGLESQLFGGKEQYAASGHGLLGVLGTPGPAESDPRGGTCPARPEPVKARSGHARHGAIRPPKARQPTH
jgi:hypothetical protein